MVGTIHERMEHKMADTIEARHPYHRDDWLRERYDSCGGRHTPLMRKDGSLDICDHCDREICSVCSACIDVEWDRMYGENNEEK